MFLAAGSPIVRATSPEPPVTIEVRPEPGDDPMTASAAVVVTAHVKVSRMVLEVAAPEGVRAQFDPIAEGLERGKTARVLVRLTAAKAGQYRLQLGIKAQAEGYETAGTNERRYLVVDGKNPARVLTGHEMQRERRVQVDERLKAGQAKDPDNGATLDTDLAGRLTKVARPPAARPRDQALAPPPPGMEPYDRAGVIDRSAQVMRALDPITVTGQFFFRDRAGALRPFVNAAIDVRDDDTGPDEHLVTTITDWDGRFSAVVDNDDGWFQNGRDIYVRIRASNSRFRVQDCSYWPDWTYAWRTDTREDLSDGTTVDFGALELVSYTEAAILFQDLNQGWNFLTTSGAQDPGFVDLCFPEDSSQYSTFWEEIDIEDGDEVAVDIVLHEYGHATMHNAYDGDWPSNTGGPHGFDDVVHPNFAFTEGWGTFIALAINPDGVYHSNGWSRGIESFNHSSGHAGGDGQQNEGHVAAAMNDVLDRASDGNCAAGNCDPSGPNRVAMSKIWRDSFWGSKADNIGAYWPRLCDQLTTAERADALKALAFNHVNLPSCACTIELAVARAANADTVVRTLRELRDRGLRGQELGDRIIELYYRHTEVVAGLMRRNDDLRAMGSTLFLRAAWAHGILKKGGRSEVLLDAKHAQLARTFIDRVQQLSDNKELRQDFETLKPLVDSFEGRTAEEVASKLRSPGARKAP